MGIGAGQAVYLPTTEGYSLLVTLRRPVAFIEALRIVVRQRGWCVDRALPRARAYETPKGLLGIRTDLCVIRLAIRRTAWIRYGDVRQV